MFLIYLRILLLFSYLSFPVLLDRSFIELAGTGQERRRTHVNGVGTGYDAAVLFHRLLHVAC